MGIANINVAIVEDNGVARINLRNHLLAMGFVDIGCYSHGRELRNAMRKRSFHLILMDFHLGPDKTGVEVIQELQQSGSLKPSTAVVFLTADSVPMVLGQIVDIHPDVVVLKPYTIRNLEKAVILTLQFRDALKPVFRELDNHRYNKALALLDEVIASKKLSKSRTNLTKLRGRLLIKAGQFKKAIALYERILQASDKVVWAQWGLVLSRYLSGDIAGSEADLERMLNTHMTKDKACEWLTRINIQKTQYQRAQGYIDMIREGDLTMSAARLKVHLCQVQDNVEDAIKLLEKKRETNRHSRERFAELTMDLARCHLVLAEKSSGKDRDNAIKAARMLIGSASRRAVDEELSLKRNYMSAMVAVLEGDEDKALEILKQDGMMELESADVSLLADAASAWMGVGEAGLASELMQECEDKMAQLQDENEKTVSSLRILKNEETMGDKKSRALEFNKSGLALFNQSEFDEGIDYFYQAHILFPKEPAFLLNLLQCMVEAKIASHKKVRSIDIYRKLLEFTLSDANQKRFNDVKAKMKADVSIHQPPATSEQTEEVADSKE
ncbi:response regulator [Neptunicella marina]|uniref:Response regulator n=1 Tax=Neptunicella marina TaxID=2125989 RepID=A0A8J6LX66_9ALTE|nr:response regulator [Neptunicella marina]MBC3764615.1 response regulator [Neptunicella marina]